MLHTSNNLPIFLCMHQKWNKECNQYITRFNMKYWKECSTIEMVSIVSVTKSELKARIQKAIEEHML